MEPNDLDKAAWVQAALARYERPLVRYAQRITGDLEQARDVVQDTFLRLCVVQRSKVNGRMAAWLYTVCRNRALDVLRKEKRTQPLDAGHAESQASPDPPPSTVAERHEAQRLVLDAFEKLPADQHEALCLKFDDQMTYREISQIMGKSLGTVSNLITTALSAVRRQLRAADLAQEA